MTIYEDLGVRTFINASGPLTRLGGALMTSYAVDAMVEASHCNVELADLQAKVGASIARLTNNEAAYISCGASSGITLAIAALMAGTDPILSEQLPDTRGMKSRVAMHAGDRGYKCDASVRCTGATIVDFGDKRGATEEQLRAILSDDIVAILIVARGHRGAIPLDRVVGIAAERGIPVLVDAAGSVPPKKNLWTFTRDFGADAVVVSGGKGLRGPQCTGLVLGRQSIIEGCRYHGVPNTRIGRGMKVGKEELAGIYAAVKHFLKEDDAQMCAGHAAQMDHIIDHLRGLPGIAARRSGPDTAAIWCADATFAMDYSAVARQLLCAKPAVYVEASRTELVVCSRCLSPGEEAVVANQMGRILSEVVMADKSRAHGATAPGEVVSRCSIARANRWKWTHGSMSTSMKVAEEMLRLANVRAQDIVYDLGCGEGNIVIAAAHCGARGVGVDNSPNALAAAARNAWAAGVADRVTLVEGDINNVDFSAATVVALYLIPATLEQIKPKLLSLRPGTRVVSHSFDLDDWAPDKVVTYEGRTLYYFVVPQKEAPPKDPILKRTLDFLLQRPGAAERRIRDLRLSNHLTVVELDDNSVGVCVSDYSLGDAQLARIGYELKRQLGEDPLLLVATDSFAPAGGVAGSIAAAVAGALSGPALDSADDAYFIRRNECPPGFFEGRDKVVVVGVEGLEDVLGQTAARHVHLLEFRYGFWKDEMEALVNGYRRRYRVELSICDRIDDRIRDADLIVIGGSTLGNGKLDGLLPACARCRRVVVQGQLTYVHPKVLFEAGVHLIATAGERREVQAAALDRTGEALVRVFGRKPPYVFLWPRESGV